MSINQYLSYDCPVMICMIYLMYVIPRRFSFLFFIIERFTHSFWAAFKERYVNAIPKIHFEIVKKAV